MKLPSLQEIKLNLKENVSIEAVLKNYPLSINPFFIDLTGVKEELTKTLLEEISLYLFKENINSSFPYPLYIITQSVESHKNLNIVKDISDITSYYKQKSKQLKTKEQSLLNKVKTLNLRNSLLDINDAVEDLNYYSERAQILKKLVKEFHFYEQVRNGINNDRKNKDKQT